MAHHFLNTPLPELTPEEHASFQAYAERTEAESARRIAAGLPVFSHILDRLRDDESDFSSGMGDGYLSYYDLQQPRPDFKATPSALYAYLMDCPESLSAEFRAGLIFGWAVAFAENEPSFFWRSDPPPSEYQH